MHTIRGLYAVTPDWPDTERLIGAVRRSLEGGARLVQYRNKSGDIALQHEQASELLAVCREFGAPLIINDNIRLAALVDADGLHLGAQDASPQEARLILGPDKIIGMSCYNSLPQALSAAREGADYIAFGSFFASPTKPQAMAAPLALLQEARRQLELPIVAIGGITRDNAPLLIDAGADAIAVISALFGCPDVRAAAFGFAALFGHAGKTLH